jgi:hypothetical protein
MDSLLGPAVGLALSTAAGLRVFVPFLLTGVAARAGWIALTPSMDWIGSDVALIAFATATAVEVVGYYVPWLDNLLDILATPAAVTAGVMLTAAATPELSPLLRWTLAIVAGGGAAGLVQAGSALLRLKSSTFTAGAANPAVATGELAGALVLSVLGLLVPLLAAVLGLILLIALVRRIARTRRRPARAAPPGGGRPAA